MALPKVRTSRANTHARRSQWKAQTAQLIAVHVPDGEVVLASVIRAMQRPSGVGPVRTLKKRSPSRTRDNSVKEDETV